MAGELTYKTYSVKCDTELSGVEVTIEGGAKTILLSKRPPNVNVWISSTVDGDKYQLLNRGDGWQNLPVLLTNFFVFTEGTNADDTLNDLVINYTGEDNYFAYGPDNTETVNKIEVVDRLSTNAIANIAYAKNIFDVKPLTASATYGSAPINKISTGHLEYCRTSGLGEILMLLYPFGKSGDTGDTVISKFAFDDNKYYRVRIQGVLGLYADAWDTALICQTQRASLMFYKLANSGLRYRALSSMAVTQASRPNDRLVNYSSTDLEAYAVNTFQSNWGTRQTSWNQTTNWCRPVTPWTSGKFILFQTNREALINSVAAIKDNNIRDCDYIFSGAQLNAYSDFCLAYSFWWGINSSDNRECSLDYSYRITITEALDINA